MQDEFRVLWWEDPAQRWREISWEAWARFRGLGKLMGIEGDRRLPGIPAGDQRFAVCVMDENGHVANIISHRYTVGANGELADASFGLTEDEQKEWDRLYLVLAPSVEEEERLKDLQRKAEPFMELPRSAIEALLRDLPGPPTPNENCGIWRFFAKLGGPVPNTRH